MAGEKLIDARTVKPLADALLEWLTDHEDTLQDGWQDPNMSPAHPVLRDAIAQATKAETITWLASLAERYGFKPPETT